MSTGWGTGWVYIVTILDYLKNPWNWFFYTCFSNIQSRGLAQRSLHSRKERGSCCHLLRVSPWRWGPAWGWGSPPRFSWARPSTPPSASPAPPRSAPGSPGQSLSQSGSWCPEIRNISTKIIYRLLKWEPRQGGLSGIHSCITQPPDLVKSIGVENIKSCKCSFLMNNETQSQKWSLLLQNFCFGYLTF